MGVKRARVATKTIAVRFFATWPSKNLSPFMVLYYDTLGQVWAAAIFFVALSAGKN